MSEQQCAATVFGETPKTAVVTTALPEDTESFSESHPLLITPGLLRVRRELLDLARHMLVSCSVIEEIV